MRSVYRVVLSSFSILMFPLALQAYSSGPLPQLTGGFSEQTCVRCHSSFSLNEGRLRGGDLHLAGAYSGVESRTAQPVSTPNEAKKPLERVNTATRLLHLPSPKGLPKGSLIFTVQHRFLGAIVDSRPGNAFGIDLGANINLELLYAPTRRLSLGVSRARFALASRSYAPAIITYTGAYTIHDVEKSFWK